jgi:hypothetical protein
MKKNQMYRLKPTMIGRAPGWVLQEKSLGFWGNMRDSQSNPIIFLGEEITYDAEVTLRHLNKDFVY